MRAILTYHSIDASRSVISCAPDVFDRHVRWLASGPVNVVPLDVLVGLPEATDAVALTFDDGFVNFERQAAPRLQALGLPATLFVVSDCVGKTNMWRGQPDAGIPEMPLLDWPALSRLAEAGIALGAHSRTHPDLTALNEAEVDDEIARSGEVIASETGQRPAAFAYPYGRFDARAARAVARSYRCGCTAEFRALDGPIDASQLPRLDAYYFSRPGLLESWGTPAFERFITRRRRLRRVRAAGVSAARRVLSLAHGRDHA